MPICLSKITISPPCHSSISETSVVRAATVCEKKPSGFVPVGNQCLHPVLLPYNPVAAPGYLRSQAPADHIRHFSTRKQLHRCKRHNHRQDNRSYNNGFYILDVCSHRSVRRSECPAGHLHRHHPDLRYYETAVFCPDSLPQAGMPMCAGNVSAHKARCCITVKVPVPLYNALLYLCWPCPNAYSHPFLFLRIPAFFPFCKPLAYIIFLKK